MADVWEWLPTRYRYLELDRYVVTPNHLRGIIIISNGPKDQSRTAQIPARKPLGRLIGAFKSVATKKVNLSATNAQSTAVAAQLLRACHTK